MGNTCKKTTVTMDEAKLATPFGSCGWSKCKSSCCKKEEEDPQLKQIQTAIRVEMALLEKMILDKMIAGLKTDGEIPQLAVLPEGAVSPETPKRTINIRV
jgi:hypothetical protein